MGMLNPRWCQSEYRVGKRNSDEAKSNALERVSVVQGTHPLRSTAPGTFAIIKLVQYLSMELYKGDRQPVLLAEPPKYGTINLYHH